MTYAIQTIIIKKSVPLDEAVRKAKDISKKKKILMRELKQTYHFRNIPKTKFEKKTFRSKQINPEITLVFAKLKPEFQHLTSPKIVGEGIFSDLASYGLRKLAPRVESAIFKSKQFNNVSTRTLNDYGDSIIQNMQIYRTPISNILNTALNLISLGKWNELRKKYGYDKLFHTALVCDIGGKNIIIEKNEVVNISTEYKTSKETQTFHINLEGKQISVNEMVENCKKRMGDEKFFDYDAFTNNCQVFIKNMLQGVGLYNNQIDKFLFQDLSEIYKRLPSYTSKIAKLITRTGAFISRLRGDGVSGGVLIEPVEEEEEKKEEEEEKKEVDLGHNLRRDDNPPERKIEAVEEPERICRRGTDLGNCFKKGMSIGFFLSNNPIVRMNKNQLIRLCELYGIPINQEEDTNKQMRDKLILAGANIDLLDFYIKEQERDLDQAINADKQDLRNRGEVVNERLYHKKKKDRLNPPLEQLNNREMVVLCGRDYSCPPVNGKNYAYQNSAELRTSLEQAGYRQNPMRVFNPPVYRRRERD